MILGAGGNRRNGVGNGGNWCHRWSVPDWHLVGFCKKETEGVEKGVYIMNSFEKGLIRL